MYDRPWTYKRESQFLSVLSSLCSFVGAITVSESHGAEFNFRLFGRFVPLLCQSTQNLKTLELNTIVLYSSFGGIAIAEGIGKSTGNADMGHV
jgi:hypothetical protein